MHLDREARVGPNGPLEHLHREHLRFCRGDVYAYRRLHVERREINAGPPDCFREFVELAIESRTPVREKRFALKVGEARAVHGAPVDSETANLSHSGDREQVKSSLGAEEPHSDDGRTITRCSCRAEVVPTQSILSNE